MEFITKLQKQFNKLNNYILNDLGMDNWGFAKFE